MIDKRFQEASNMKVLFILNYQPECVYSLFYLQTLDD